MSRRMLFLSGALSLAMVSLAAAADQPIVPKDAKLELLYTRTADIKGGLTEGPAVAPDGSIYFTDIPVGADKSLIVRFDPQTKKTSTFAADGGKSNGLAFDANGYLISCEGNDTGGRRVARWDTKTGKSQTIVDRYMGKKFNAPNDLVLDAKGRIYFTDPRYMGNEPRELDYRAVYRVDGDGKNVVEVTHEVEKPNGIALSPDGKTLYVADHNNGSDGADGSPAKPPKGAMKVYSYPLGPDGLVAGPRKTIYDFGTEDGCDGMCVDSAGRIYLTARSAKRPGVLVIDSNGKEQAFIATGEPNQEDAKDPKGFPSNVEFGRGADNNVLYITVDKSLYRIRLNAQGFHLDLAK